MAMCFCHSAQYIAKDTATRANVNAYGILFLLSALQKQKAKKIRYADDANTTDKNNVMRRGAKHLQNAQKKNKLLTVFFLTVKL